MRGAQAAAAISCQVRSLAPTRTRWVTTRVRRLGISRLLIVTRPDWTNCTLVWYPRIRSASVPTKHGIESMKGAFRLPNFSVIVWIKKNEGFPTLRSQLITAAGMEPYESTEYQGMVDFHWRAGNLNEAKTIAESLKSAALHPDLVLLRIMSLVDGIESITIKDERRTKH